MNAYARIEHRVFSYSRMRIPQEKNYIEVVIKF